MEEGDTAAVEGPLKPVERTGRISRKLLAIILVAILLGVSGFYVWYEYYRPWSIGDLEDAVITWEYDGMNSAGIDVGFKTYLEGRTVTVKGTVHETHSLNTSLGQLNFIYLEGGTFVSLMQWGPLDSSDGDRIKMRVTFERGVVNGAEHVYSPQVGFPGYGIFASNQVIMQAGSWSRGEWMVSAEDQGDDVVVRVEKAPDPVPLEMVSCFIKQGVNTGALEYIDILGYCEDIPDLDTIQDLRTPNGQNGTLDFHDDNNDGYLDDGDYITIHGAIRPETASGGQSYFLSVERDPYPEEPELASTPCFFCVYLVMTDRGLLWTTHEGSPVGTSHVSGTEDGFSVVVDYISEPASWNETELMMSHEAAFAKWTPEVGQLSQGPDSSYSCGILEVGDLQIECMIMDVEGDGLVGTRDRIDLLAANGTGFEEGDVITFSLIHTPEGGSVLREQFTYGAVPASECQVSIGADYAMIALAPIHNGTDYDYELIDVSWDEVVISIDDGQNETEWALSSDDLDNGIPILWTSAEIALGDLLVMCNVTDIQGNGLANTGDTIEVSVAEGGVFDPGTEYTVAVIHIPTGADIFSATFSG